MTPYPALLYPIVEALPPRHAAVRRHPPASESAAAGAGTGAVPFASLFDIGAIGSARFAGRGREEEDDGGGGGGSEQDSGQVGFCVHSLDVPLNERCCSKE